MTGIISRESAYPLRTALAVLGNTGWKTVIHRYLKAPREESASLTPAASLSDAIQDLVAGLAARRCILPATSSAAEIGKLNS